MAYCCDAVDSTVVSRASSVSLAVWPACASAQRPSARDTCDMGAVHARSRAHVRPSRLSALSRHEHTLTI